MSALWTDKRINERINEVLASQPNHTPRGLVRRVSYAVRDDYEERIAELEKTVAQLRAEKQYAIETLQSLGMPIEDIIVETLAVPS